MYINVSITFPLYNTQIWCLAGTQLIEELLSIPYLRVRAKKLDHETTDADIKAFLLEMRHILVTNFVIAANKTWTSSILNEVCLSCSSDI